MGGFRTSLNTKTVCFSWSKAIAIPTSTSDHPAMAPQSPKGPISRRSSHTTVRCPESLSPANPPLWSSHPICTFTAAAITSMNASGFPLRVRNLKGIGGTAVTTHRKSQDQDIPTLTRPPIMEEMKTTALEEPFSIFGRSCWANHAPCFALAPVFQPSDARNRSVLMYKCPTQTCTGVTP